MGGWPAGRPLLALDGVSIGGWQAVWLSWILAGCASCARAECAAGKWRCHAAGFELAAHIDNGDRAIAHFGFVRNVWQLLRADGRQLELATPAVDVREHALLGT